MLKRIEDFEGSDFGSLNEYQSGLLLREDGLVGSQSGNLNIVHRNEDGIRGEFYTKEDLISGGSVIITGDDFLNPKSAELAIDYSNPSNLAYFGSVYSFISAAINNIRNTYPNGALIVSAATSTNTLLYNYADTYNYGSYPIDIGNYTNYEVVQSSGDVYYATYQITAATTGRTYAILYLDSTPISGSGVDTMVQPKDFVLDRYYSKLGGYERDILVSGSERTNYWPRDLIAENNILFEGDRYDSFVEEELSWGINSDDGSSNFLWDRLYPEGQKQFDTEDGLMQRLILVYGASFDIIKKYQDHLRYQHSIGYDSSDHVSKDVVGLLARQWNVMLGSSVNRETYDKFVYKTYEDYISAYSNRKLSLKDADFELWRRLLSNIVRLYKMKGTVNGIQYITNIFNLPSSLLRINEYIRQGEFGDETIESDLNIAVKTDDGLYGVSDTGYITRLDVQRPVNTKYCDITLSPADAIDQDFYEWAWEDHGDVLNMDGVLVALTGYSAEPGQRKWVRDISERVIGSGNIARYASKYWSLAALGDSYYSASTNKYTFINFLPYLQLLDNRWPEVVGGFVPASSRLLATGSLYKNRFWERQKHQWSRSELEAKPLPTNKDAVLGPVSLPVSVESKKSASIQIPNVEPSFYAKKAAEVVIQTISPEYEHRKSASLGLFLETSAKNSKLHASATTIENSASYVEQYEDTYGVAVSSTGGTSFVLSSPKIVITDGDAGTPDFIEYSSDMFVVSQSPYIPLVVSASNLSTSGYSMVRFDLFKKQSSEPIIDYDTEYSITRVEYENGTCGVYKVSSTSGIKESSSININSVFPVENQLTFVTSVNSGTSTIRTEPRIGMFYTRSGNNGNSVNWVEFLASGSVNRIRILKTECLVSYQSIINASKIIVDYKNGTLPYDEAIAKIKNNFELSLLEVAGVIVSEYDNYEAIEAYYKYLSSSPYVMQIAESMMNETYNNLYGNIVSCEYLKTRPTLINDSDMNIINAVANNQVSAKFNRVISLFDWEYPDQTSIYDNLAYTANSNWNFSTLSVANRSYSANTGSATGTVLVGGYDDLNNRVLQDKEEYFLRFSVKTHLPTIYGDVLSLEQFSSSYGGGPLLESGYDVLDYNNIKYYGNYFMYLNTPNRALILSMPNSGETTDTSSVLLKFNGVGDSDSLELQFMSVSSAPTTSYTALTESSWSAATKVNVPVVSGSNDSYAYSVQTSLLPDTYYWWRINNYRGKKNIFGRNIQYFTSTVPEWFKTGEFDGGGSTDGPIDVIPKPPRYEISLSFNDS